MLRVIFNNGQWSTGQRLIGIKIYVLLKARKLHDSRTTFRITFHNSLRSLHVPLYTDSPKPDVFKT